MKKKKKKDRKGKNRKRKHSDLLQQEFDNIQVHQSWQHKKEE